MAAPALRSLRLRLALLLFAAIAFVSLLVTWSSSRELASAYSEAGKSEALAIARSFADDFSKADLDRPEQLEQRLRTLRQLNPNVHKASIYTLAPDRGVRVASTDREELGIAVEAHDVAPIRTGQFDYEEEHERGPHVGEVNFPLEESGTGERVASLGLYFDLAPLDASLAGRRRAMIAAGASAAVFLAVLMALVLSRAVFRPLDRLRVHTGRIRVGELDARLSWSRSDEIGELAQDFDEMAQELEESHKRLRELALKDTLTGLLNYRAFQERLAQELGRARRESYPVTVVAVDVDNFKEINDSTGHAVGDEALRLLSQAMLSMLRPSDICGRVGGDEFVIALPKVDARQAEEVVARLLSAASAIAVGPARTFMTISAGAAEYPGHTTEQADLMRLADGAMYWSKRRGRNRYSVYEPESGDALSPQEDVDQIRRRSLVNTVYALAVAVDAKDGYTYLHSERVAHYAATLAGSIGLQSERTELIRTAGLLHDVGKIGISDAILVKPGKLTTEEVTEMERHSSLGRDIIAGAGMAEIARWVLHLHERFDGSGYPDGLAGNEIPLESRVLLVADALEAMTSSRIYRGALPVADALLELERASGTQLDPWLASEMVALIRTGRLMVGELRPVADDIQPQPIDEPAWIDELARRRTS